MRLISHYIAPPLVVVLLIVLISIQAHSTTAVVFVSTHGIAIAMDRKIVVQGAVSSESQVGKIGEGEGLKYVIIQNRFVIANVGYGVLESYNPVNKTMINYEFSAWVHGIESGLPKNVSFGDFLKIVNSEAGKMVPILQTLVTRGRMKQNDPSNIFESPIQYVIAGYQDGVPRVSVIEFYVDWNAKTALGPYQVPIEPDEGPIAGHTRIHLFGVAEAIADFTNRHSYAYKQAMTICPKAFEDYIGTRPLSFDEGIAVSRALVQIEKQTNPELVGGDVRIVQILPTGGARDSVERPTRSLPKAKTGK